MPLPVSRSIYPASDVEHPVTFDVGLIREPVYDRLAFVRQSAQEVYLVYICTATLETCSATTDTVVVIDVWRSFTTAPFAAGARDIVPIGSVGE
jgi:hypothetical protein